MITVLWGVRLSSQLLTVLSLLLALGLLMVFSSSSPLATRISGNEHYFLQKQFLFLMVGGIAFLGASFFPYKRYETLAYWAMGVALVLLILVLVPGIGMKVSGARRWIRFYGLGIQPSEFLKIAMILWAAAFFCRKKEHISKYSRTLAPSMLILMIYLSLLLAQPDFGSTVLLSLTLLLMAITYGVRLLHVSFTLTLVSLGSVALILQDSYGYRIRRIVAFMDPWADPHDSGYQLINSLIAFGSGGWSGKGLGQSLQKHYFLPQPHTDFIFAIIGEELGFLGIMLFIVLFLWFLRIGFKIAATCNDDFGRNVAFGITVLLAMQIILHMCVVTGMLPTKGIGLPFISYGGSALVTNLLMIGILYNIAKTLAHQKSLLHAPKRMSQVGRRNY